MVDIVNVSLLDVIPESLKNDPIVIAMIKSIDDEIKAVSKLSETPSLYANIDALESLKLDHLAWQYSADTWRDNWPIDLKRSVIKNVIHEKRKKGSLAAVEDAISSLGSAGVITEWWELSPPGEPHTFSVTASINDFNGTIPSAQMQEDIISRIDSVKPTRSHYEFTQSLQSKGGLGFIGAASIITYARISGHEQ